MVNIGRFSPRTYELRRQRQRERGRDRKKWRQRRFQRRVRSVKYVSSSECFLVFRITAIFKTEPWLIKCTLFPEKAPGTVKTSQYFPGIQITLADSHSIVGFPVE